MGADWRELTWWEYQARLWHWNEANKGEGGLPEPDYERIRRMMVH